MRLQIPYNKIQMNIEIPDANFQGVLESPCHNLMPATRTKPRQGLGCYPPSIQPINGANGVLQALILTGIYHTEGNLPQTQNKI